MTLKIEELLLLPSHQILATYQFGDLSLIADSPKFGF